MLKEMELSGAGERDFGKCKDEFPFADEVCVGFKGYRRC
jgi:hypothetical protein